MLRRQEVIDHVVNFWKDDDVVPDVYTTPDDAFTPVNRNLLSNIFSEYVQDVDEADYLLKNPDDVNLLLQTAANNKPYDIRIALAFDYSSGEKDIFISYSKDSEFIYFYKDKLFFAKGTRKEHTFPSGDSYPFILLDEEKSANYPITSSYFSHIYGLNFLRQNSLLFYEGISNLFLENNVRGPTSFQRDDLISVLLAHSMVLQELVLLEPNFSGNNLMMTCSRETPRYLKKLGVSEEIYRGIMTALKL